jgi:hypothetical protein
MIIIFAIAIDWELKRNPEKYNPPKPKPKKKRKCKTCNDRGYRILNGNLIPCPVCNMDGMKEWMDGHDDEIDHFMVVDIIDEDNDLHS